MERHADRPGGGVSLPSQGLECFLRIVEREFVGVQPFQPVPVLFQHPEGLDIGVAGLGIDPLEDEFLVNDRLDIKRDGLVPCLDAAQHHRTSDAGRRDGVLDRRRGARHHVERDIDAPSPGDRHHALDHVLAVGFDGVIGAERLGQA